MTQNTWYTVARTPDSECTGRVFFSIGESSLSFDVFIQYGNISISIVSAVVEADTVFSMRVRSYAGFCYVDVKSNREYSSSPSVSVSQTLGTLVVMPFIEAGDGKQECIVSTDSWAPAPVADTYVTTDTIQAVTALKYFEDGIAIGDHDSYWALVYGNDGVYLGGKRIITAQDVLGYATQNWVLAKGYITSAALTGYVNGGAYNSTTKNIELKHGSTVVAQIDATAFIKDGMVDTVVVEDGYLVITFNTDSGKEPISIALTDIFDADSYYTKDEADAKFLTEHQSLTGYATQSWVTSQGYLTSYTETDPTVPSWAKQSSKPSYSYSEITGTPAIPESTSDLTNDSGFITASDIPTDVSAFTNDAGYLTSYTETDPTVPSWAKASTKPTYTASEVGALPASTSIPSKTSDLTNDSGFITSSAIPTNVSSFTNDAGYLTQHQSLDGLTPKVQAIPYIVGPDTDTTAGTWTGTYTGITALTDGLTIIYVPHVAGASTTKLNINGLGAFICYYTNTAKITTHYAVGVPILLTYRTVDSVGRWCRADYNSNTTYSAGTKALFDEGTNTSNRVWSAKVLADSVAPIEHEHNWSDINNAPAFITTDALNGYATESWVSQNFNFYTLPAASANNLGGVKVGTGLAIDANGVLSVSGGGVAVDWTDISNTPSTLSGYGITDAKIANGTITLGSNTITPITSHQSLSGYATETWVGQQGFLTSYTETDPTVPSWAKASTKPSYSYSEISNTPSIPSNTSDLTNDSGFITSSDIPSSYAWSAITSTPTTLSGYGITDAKISNGIITLGSNTITPLTSFTETDPTVPSWAKASSKPSYTFSEIGTTPTTISGYGITDAKIENGVITLGSNTITPLTSFTESDPTVPSWAKASSKPSYNFSEIGSTPTTLSGYGITDAKISSGTITLGSDTITPLTSFTETDPTVPSWAKASSKPTYGLSEITGTDDLQAIEALTGTSGLLKKTAANTWALDTNTYALSSALSGYVPTTRKVNSKALSADITLSLDDVANGSTRKLPTKVSDLTNDSGFITSYTETDPVFSASAAAGISSTDTGHWDTAYGWGDHAQAGYLTSVAFSNLTAHPTTLSGYGITDAKIENGTITLGSSTITPLTSHQSLSGYATETWVGQQGFLTSHQSLAGYLPLTAGSTKALTGELYLDATTDKNYIYGQHASDEAYVVIGMSALGNIVIGSSDFQAAEYKSYIYAYEHNLYWGTGTNKRLYFTAAGVIRPTTNNNISLGTSSYKYKELYATTLYGNLDWSYIQNKPTKLSDLTNDVGYVTDGYVDSEITDYAQKKITVSSSEPTSSQGSDGDIWIVI